MSAIDADPIAQHQVPTNIALNPEARLALRRALAARRWTQGTLAEHAHISRQSVSAVVRGKAVSPSTLAAIAQALAHERPHRDVLDLIDGRLE